MKRKSNVKKHIRRTKKGPTIVKRHGRTITVKRKLILGSGKKVDGILTGEKGSDVDSIKVKYKNKWVDPRKIKEKKVFPISSLSETPFIDVDVVKPKRSHKRTDFKLKKNDLGEWEVQALKDGKKDEARTYYTDDEQDAIDTKRQMEEEEKLGRQYRAIINSKKLDEYM